MADTHLLQPRGGSACGRGTVANADINTVTCLRCRRVHDAIVELTIDQRTEISHAFDRGNYANAYETTDIDECQFNDMAEHERVAFILGFFGSYTLAEIGSDRELYDECYWSATGRYVVTIAKYCDDRADEYASERPHADAPCGTEGCNADDHAWCPTAK